MTVRSCGNGFQREGPSKPSPPTPRATSLSLQAAFLHAWRKEGDAQERSSWQRLLWCVPRRKQSEAVRSRRGPRQSAREAPYTRRWDDDGGDQTSGTTLGCQCHHQDQTYVAGILKAVLSKIRRRSLSKGRGQERNGWVERSKKIKSCGEGRSGLDARTLEAKFCKLTVGICGQSLHNLL